MLSVSTRTLPRFSKNSLLQTYTGIYIVNYVIMLIMPNYINMLLCYYNMLLCYNNRVSLIQCLEYLLECH